MVPSRKSGSDEDRPRVGSGTRSLSSDLKGERGAVVRPDLVVTGAAASAIPTEVRVDCWSSCSSSELVVGHRDARVWDLEIAGGWQVATGSAMCGTFPPTRRGLP